MKPVQHYGTFSDEGRLQAGSFWAALKALRIRGVPVVLTVSEFHPKRSNQANAYYFGVVIPEICKALIDAGWDPEECVPEQVHDGLKRMFLSKAKPVTDDGIYLELTPSTAKMDKEEFGAYLERVIRFAAEELSWAIPPPNTQLNAL